jgi:hypothetical protein
MGEWGVFCESRECGEAINNYELTMYICLSNKMKVFKNIDL